MGSVLILGGSSDIGLAIAHRFAGDGHTIALAARHPDRLTSEQSDIRLRYDVDVTLHEFDVLDIASHETFIQSLPVLPQIAVCAVGLLGDQENDQVDSESAAAVMRSNYEGPASILGSVANHFEERGSGVIVGISSVAGDRGRASNYIYGSAKAGFSAFLSGLRGRLTANGVHVVTVKPGFVRTKMIGNQQPPRVLTVDPHDVAMSIQWAVARRRNTVYVGRRWRMLMTIVRLLPEGIFKRTKF